MKCKNCGKEMLGDGEYLVYHCPIADSILGVDPEEDPIYCDTDLSYDQED